MQTKNTLAPIVNSQCLIRVRIGFLKLTCEKKNTSGDLLSTGQTL